MKKSDPDLVMLEDLLDHHAEAVREHSRTAFDAFTEWRERHQRNPGYKLSRAQSAWLFGVAERIGVITAAPAENHFSALSKKEQARQKERAAAVKLPWEQDPGEVTKFLVGEKDGTLVIRQVQARFVVSADGVRGYVCKLRSSGHCALIEFVPEEKMHDTACAAFERKKALEAERKKEKRR